MFIKCQDMLLSPEFKNNLHKPQRVLTLVLGLEVVDDEFIISAVQEFVGVHTALFRIEFPLHV